MLQLEGNLKKMQVDLNSPVNYWINSLEGDDFSVNQALGKKLSLQHLGEINCVHCGRKTRKSFNQGYCYPCLIGLAQCDTCIVSPEKCHFHLGTCREPEWGEQNCMRKHFVYLANSSGLKVGITREENIPSRWIDQGAVQALPIFAVDSRYLSGLTEVVFKKVTADRTNWRTMLKGEQEELNLIDERDRLMGEIGQDIQDLQQTHGLQAVQLLSDAKQVNIEYPVLEYPTKVSSHNLDKTPLVEGVLQGIKAQYLILDTGVINIRKYAGYAIELSMH